MPKNTTRFSSDQLPLQEIPYGYCQCGCGQQTEISRYTVTKRGQIKGQHLRFINGHNRRKNFPVPEIKYCECGCGQVTPIAQVTNYTRKSIRGQHQRFVAGHAARLRPFQDISERFWKKVKKAGPDECWEWVGAHGMQGHGTFTVGSKRNKTRRSIPAHRLAYILEYGSIPNDKEACHKCDNPPCCNPKHIFAGTHLENMRDMVVKGRSTKGERSGNSKLTENNIYEIRELRENGMKHSEIAKLYNVSKGAIQAILAGKRWKHI